jgi:nicotinamide riboside transporter PnuC
LSEPTNYKQERLQKEIDWHSKRAKDNKTKFRICQIIILVAGATIPIINVASIMDSQRIISSVIGGLIVIVTGLTQLEKYQENWILYRTTVF